MFLERRGVSATGVDKQTKKNGRAGCRGKAGPGRPKGSRNKVQKELRVIVAEFVEHNMGRAQQLFDRVAKRNPTQALKILFEAQDYVLPRLQRTELKLPPPSVEAPTGEFPLDPNEAAKVYLAFVRGEKYRPTFQGSAPAPQASQSAALAAPASEPARAAFAPPAVETEQHQILASTAPQQALEVQHEVSRTPVVIESAASPPTRTAVAAGPGGQFVDMELTNEGIWSLARREKLLAEDPTLAALESTARALQLSAQRRAENEARLEIENAKAREAQRICEERLAQEHR
jgi:hypothetical protein